MWTSQFGVSGKNGMTIAAAAGNPAHTKHTQRQGKNAPKVYTKVIPELTENGPQPAIVPLEKY